ncbi:MAG: hypothetical protein LBS96_01025 [Oscillospiraceae bacterium]|jgi:hypothetical protein|nr:hypothetical protein [Oscillospiraceae bacterium]
MTVCPKCQKRLRITDWRPNCPHCGVNLMFYGFEERFYADAKLAELSQAGMRVRWKIIKAGWAGNRTAKIRLFTMVLPLLALLAPVAALRVELPFAQQNWNAGLLGVVSFVLGGGGPLGFLQAEMSSPLFGNVFRLFAVTLALVVLAAVFGLLVFLASIFSAFSVRRMSAVIMVLNFLGAAMMLGAFVAAILFARASHAGDFISASLSFGAPLAALVFIGVGIINRKLWKHGVDVSFLEGDEERAAIYKKVKSHAVQLADLPYPVVETEATRALEAAIQADLARGAETAAAEGGDAT